MASAPDKVITLYKNKITIDYWDARHLYIVRETGKVPLSVTGATGIIDKPALKIWAVNLTRDFLLDLVRRKKPITEQAIIDASKLHQQRTKAAATLGSLVHDWVEAHIKGQNPIMPADPRVLNGVMAFLKWVEEHQVKFISSEQVVYSLKHDYVGTMDCKFTMGIESHKIVHAGDFKTGKAIYPEYRYQVAGYQEADTEESGQKYGSKWLMRFDKETADFEALEYHEHKEDLKAFLGCLDVKRRQKLLSGNRYK